ncbi:MAG: HAMP domain-containing histidine kinase [Rhodobacteraceae bacterium]|nr:HAMP domain-containing histidine kinase [Paracoccaceae bacterium]
MLLVLPLLTLALLGAWYVDAKRVADAEAQRVAQLRHADLQAAEVLQAIEDATLARMRAVLSGFETGAGIAVRNHYLSDDVTEMVAIYDADGGLLFPEDQELRLFAEDTVLRRNDLRLLSARQSANSEHTSWVGTIRDREAGTVACRLVGDLTICLLLRADRLREIAEHAVGDGRIIYLSAPAPVPAAQNRAIAVLSEPLNGLAIAVDYDTLFGNSWLLVAAIAVPTLLASAIAALALQTAHRARVGAAEHRANVLSDVSHELRTPLANLRLYADLLRSHKSDGTKIDRYAAVIEDEATRLGWIVDNALALSTRDTAPARQLQRAEPNSVVTALIERYGPLLHDARDLRLDLRAPDPVEFDVRTFEQVLINVLDNARKHAPGATVNVQCWVSGNGLYLKLSDDGAKIPPKHDGLNGFGLGLRACATLARLAGGRFDHALAPGGSWFTLRLPLEAAPMQEIGRSAVPT